MDSLLQLCTVALVATVAWPVCWLCGATSGWLAWHFHFLVWVWVMNGGFAAALALSDAAEKRLAEWAAMPAQESPLAWFGIVLFVVLSIGTTVWLMWPEWHLRREITRRGASAILDHGRTGVDP